MSLEFINIGTTANDDTGDNMRSAGGKINEAIAGINLLGDSTVSNNKIIIPAAAMLPLTENSAYWLNSALFPAQVFSDTVTEGVVIQFFDIANLIPAGAHAKPKVRLQAFHSETDEPSDFDVAWKVEAAWIADGAEAVTFGIAQYVVQTVESDPNKPIWSLQTAEIAPGGSREAAAELRLKISRDVAYEVSEVVQDTLDAPAKLYKIEIEWS